MESYKEQVLLWHHNMAEQELKYADESLPY